MTCLNAWESCDHVLIRRIYVQTGFHSFGLFLLNMVMFVDLCLENRRVLIIFGEM